ncbi:MAG: hypothetical protein Q9226_008358, partial [Calogaya cf. arnoldii]
MATTTAEKQTQKAASAPSQVTEDSLRNRVHADETTSPQAPSRAYTETLTSDQTIPNDEPTNSANPETTKLGYKIIKGEKCCPELPTFDFDPPWYPSPFHFTPYAFRTMLQILRDHAHAAINLEKIIRDQQNKLQVNGSLNNQITQDFARAWCGPIERLRGKAQHWVEELNKEIDS